MRIIRLEASNVKRLKAVQITPDGNVVVIKGANGAGKSSCLDAIAYALGGRDVHPPKVIREGQDHARVVLELDDLVVERRWTPKGTYLEVRSHAGAKFPSPQAMLDKLVGSLSFDPLAFTRMEKKRQVETLRALVGIDFAELDRRRQETFDARTLVNRELAGLKAQLERTPPLPSNAPTEEVSVADLVQEQQQLLAAKTANENRRIRVASDARELELLRRRVAAEKTAIEDLEAKLRMTRERLQRLEDEAELKADALGAEQEEVAGLVDPDVASVTERIRTVEATNAAVRKARERRDLEQKLSARAKEAEGLTTAIATVDAEKQKALAEAKFPVAGLSFGDEGITLNGIPLEQASAAEQLRVSVAISAAMNPKLRVVLVRDASLLDEKSLAYLAKLASEHDLQVWLEVVGTGGEVGVVIEDGEVRGSAEQVASAPGFQPVEVGGAA